MVTIAIPFSSKMYISWFQIEKQHIESMKTIKDILKQSKQA